MNMMKLVLGFLVTIGVYASDSFLQNFDNLRMGDKFGLIYEIVGFIDDHPVDFTGTVIFHKKGEVIEAVLKSENEKYPSIACTIDQNGKVVASVRDLLALTNRAAKKNYLIDHSEWFQYIKILIEENFAVYVNALFGDRKDLSSRDIDYEMEYDQFPSRFEVSKQNRDGGYSFYLTATKTTVLGW